MTETSQDTTPQDGGNDVALLVELDGHVETWTLNRPDSRNPISDDDMVAAIVDAVDAANANPEVRVVILTGAGKAFSAGGDVKKMRDQSGMFGGHPHQMRNGYRYGIQQIPLALQRLDVPLIAAVNGPAVGAGCDLTAMADMRIASETAWFAESFVKLGIIPGDGGAWFLPRLVGPARAAEMTLTGDRVDAKTALEWGLVSRVVAPEDLMSEARALADRVAVNPPHAVRMAKKLLKESDGSNLSSLLELSAAMQPLAHSAPDHAEAIGAFLDKRDATFTGE
ncbi:MAG: crotonase/enoyl-CoA hydratase family protein [Brevibacterium yomogidense]|uniref:Enoyl-CoA hydratase n=1 Tax=Brevibacterium yomogidense TaxID=946573 RepID=A0A1X6WUK1_9MICO|nr:MULTISPECIES: crotonase/enoyl-CoA hydratase family protein [Brevibacterium]SLM88932.1 Enoyl-CoA hydratase [Brevibacterium yomogidense]SMX83871.1 Enoyl-CoA hydratase/carnithine racemase [Brevibacterium sp. Mu109]